MSSRRLRRLVSIFETAVVVMSLSIEVEDAQCSVARCTVVHELLQHIDVEVVDTSPNRCLSSEVDVVGCSVCCLAW